MNKLWTANRSSVKPLKPNKDLVRLTEIVLSQNKLILEMNARLLASLSNPCMSIDPTPITMFDPDAFPGKVILKDK